MSLGGWGEEKKESSRGMMGKGKKGSAFPSSHRPPRACCFSIIAIFIGIPGGSLSLTPRTLYYA